MALIAGAAGQKWEERGAERHQKAGAPHVRNPSQKLPKDLHPKDCADSQRPCCTVRVIRFTLRRLSDAFLAARCVCCRALQFCAAAGGEPGAAQRAALLVVRPWAAACCLCACSCSKLLTWSMESATRRQSHDPRRQSECPVLHWPGPCRCADHGRFWTAFMCLCSFQHPRISCCPCACSGGRRRPHTWCGQMRARCSGWRSCGGRRCRGGLLPALAALSRWALQCYQCCCEFSGLHVVFDVLVLLWA